MPRLEILDGMRGYFLVFMLLNHLTFQNGFLLVRINHGELGYVQDAQGFVFLSGLLIGLVYSNHMARRGYEVAASRVRKRAFELYRWALGCVVAVAIAGLFLKGAQAAWQPWLWDIAKNPILLISASATLLYQPTFMDILPQYIVYLVVAPPLLWLCLTGRWRMVALASAFLWIFVQFGLHLPLADMIDSGLRMIDRRLALRAHFNVLAWQVVFMSGLVLGALTATKQVDWKTVFKPENTELAWGALAMVLLFMGWRLGFTLGIIPDGPVAQRFTGLEIRGEFGLVYLLNFAALAYLMAWILIAGPRSSNQIVRTVAAWLRGLFTLSFLRLIGRHSLQVYVYHVIVVYLLRVVDYRHGPFNEAWKTSIALTAIASLAIPALWREWRASRAAGAQAA